jgi:hypothetical protein
MTLIDSIHWQWKRKKRQDISDDIIEYAISHSIIIEDRKWEGLFNAICKVPPSGRTLKVVWRRLKSQEIKVITAYWLD